MNATYLIKVVGSLSLCFTISGRAALAEKHVEETSGEAMRKTVFESSSGRDLRYAVLRPAEVDKDQRYALVVALHGSGGRGAKNWERNCSANRILTKPAMREEFPCFIVAPTVNKPDSWSGERLPDVIELIEDFIKKIAN